MVRKELTVLICIVTVAIFSVLVLVPASVGQGLKIGFVDPRVILDRMPEAKAAQQRIQNLFEKKQNELVLKEQELQTEIELFQQKIGVISEEARLVEEERLTQLDEEFRRLQSEAQQEIQQQRAELMAPLLERIQASVRNVSMQRELDLILNITTDGYGVLDRNILYVSPELQTEYNITSTVMENLDL